MKLLLFISFLLFCPKILFSQQVIPATGGNISGSGGSVSYTIGQIAYAFLQNNSYEITQGVQQPFEILVLSDNGDDGISAPVCSVFPNPTSDQLTIRIEEINRKDMIISLFKADGKLLLKQNITDFETMLPMAGLPSGIYLLEINVFDKVIRSFKIIKTIR